MKTIAEVQAAVDDIRAVCEKHGIVLFGACDMTYGEIAICDAASVGQSWTGLEAQLTNTVIEVPDEQAFFVNGIGRPVV